MEIEQVRKLKRIAEQNIYKSVETNIEVFIKETGCLVLGVDISMVDITTIDDKNQRLALGSCTIGCEI